MIRWPYSHEFFPPAPVLEVYLAFPERTPDIGPLTALLDTGADGTFVPTDLLEQLAVPVDYMTNVRSHLGERLHRVAVHKVDLLFSDVLRLPAIEVVSDDWGDQIILGRNVANKLVILLDGLKQRTSLSG